MNEYGHFSATHIYQRDSHRLGACFRRTVMLGVSIDVGAVVGKQKSCVRRMVR
jgi:hypothetical protein